MENNKNLIKLMIAVSVIVVVCEFVGEYTISIGAVSLVLFPMLYAVVIGIIITPDLLGKKIKPLKNIIGEKEINLASELVGITESHAVDFASGMASHGAKLVFSVISSFLQRIYDQLSQDLAIDKNPALILVHMAGVSPTDVTHL